MHILLVSPINRSYVIMPSLGLGYIASAARAAGHTVSLLHCLQAKLTFEGFEAYLQRNSFDVIALQMFSFDLTPVARHLAIAKRAVLSPGGYRSPERWTMASGGRFAAARDYFCFSEFLLGLFLFFGNTVAAVFRPPYEVRSPACSISS